MIDPATLNLSILPWVPLDATAGFPAQPGIYFAIDSQDVIQYIGRSGNVRGRWKCHHRYEDLDRIGGIRIVYLFVESPSLLPEIEAALIEHFDPPLNVARKRVEQAAEPHSSRAKGLRNKIKSFVDGRGMTRYQFQKETGIAMNTAYDLYSKPEQIPSAAVLSKICNTYKMQPGEFLEWVKR